jgi:hypothetical protein
MRTEDALFVMWDGDDGQVEVAGFEVGGLWATAGYPAVDSPAAPRQLWPPGTEVVPWRMHGPGWVVPLWRFRVRSWPAAEEWRGLVQATLQSMTEGGAAISWLSPDLEFSDPPSLFSWEHTAAAISAPTGFVCSAVIGKEVQWLPSEIQEALRVEALRLVDLRLPDPDTD